MRLLLHSDFPSKLIPPVLRNPVLTFLSGYLAPQIYAGTATVEQYYANVNATHWTMVYKCVRCLIFDDPSQTSFNTSTSAGNFQQGWAQSYEPPYDPLDPDSGFSQHNNGMGEFEILVASATQASYSVWATSTITGITSATVSSTATATYSSKPVPTSTYDYVIVGGGAGGVPLADKLSESGKSVLLIEKGVASSARWGGSKYHASKFRLRLTE